MTGAKVSKASVDYRRSYWPWRRCAGCSMFRPPGTCTLVAGRIKPGDVCDDWDPK